MQISVTLVNGKVIALDTFAIKEYAVNPNNSSYVDIYYYSEGAIANIATVIQSTADISKLAPTFISVTDVTQSLFGEGIVATIPFTVVSGTIVAGNYITINGIGAGICTSNSGGNLVVTGLTAPIVASAHIVGLNGATPTGTATISGTVTYTYNYSKTRFINTLFRGTNVSPWSVGGVNCIYFFDEDSSILDQIYVSNSLTSLKSAINGIGVVTQITSITTGVTLDTQKGIITTVSSTLAAGASARFTVTNKFITSTSQLQATLIDYSGTFTTNGLPDCVIDNVTTGAFDIILFNAHGTNALSGTTKIQFNILNP